MSNEAHLAENAITAYERNNKDYHKGFEEFNNQINIDQAEVIDIHNLKSLYEIIIESYEYDLF